MPNSNIPPATPSAALSGDQVRVALEMAILLVLAWAGFAATPLLTGEIGLSWDALNHHIYLGWTAQSPRFGLDVLPASYQTYQFPYLYWPVYVFATAGWSGRNTGLALAALQLIAVPPVWMIAHYCMPGRAWFDVSMRAMSVMLAFLSGVVLSLFDSTANDLLAAAPFLWALALALRPFGGQNLSRAQTRSGVLLSGLLAGVSVACKLSNGPLVLLLPPLWFVVAGHEYRRGLLLVLYAGAATLLGFALAYGYWGWQLWTHFGNPFFPFFDNWFKAVRLTLGWSA